MYHPTTRVLTVLELLQARGRVTGPELAERLEVNVRTARRYIAMLQDLGIPVEAERGRHGAYRLRPGFKLPPLMFTDEETLALTVGLQAARQLGLAAAAPAVEGALAKIMRVLPPSLRAQVQAVRETLVLDLATSDAAPSGEVVVTLSAAAQRGQQVWLRYRSGRDEQTERMIDPYGLVYRAGRWYAVGYCHMRAGLRVFRLDRVLAAELHLATFSRPAEFDCLAYVVRSLATSPGAWAVEALLEASIERAQQLVSPTLAVLEQVPEGVLLRCDVENLPWMARYLASLNCRVTVRRPAELRAELRRLALEIGAMADR